MQSWSLQRILQLVTITGFTVSHFMAVFCDRLVCLLLVFVGVFLSSPSI